MGESIVEKHSVEKKMDEGAHAANSLEVSVSFGRFENDSLSWEKWSSFTPNKYLEEVGKCSTPGSVAQKKAYFEAHYKKIAAKKAEQLEQDKPIASPPTPTRDESEKKSHIKHTYVADEELELSSNGRSGEDLEPEEMPIEPPHPRSDEADSKSQIKHTAVVNEDCDVFSNERSEENLDPDVSKNCTVNLATFEGEKENAAITEDRRDLSVVKTEEELNGGPANTISNDKQEVKEELIQNKADFNLTAREETAKIQGETTSMISPDNIVEQSSKGDESKGNPGNKNKLKLPVRDTAQKAKMSPRKKEPSPPAAKKNVASPVRKSLTTTTKFSQVPTPGLSKSTMMPASRTSTKKVSRPSFAKSDFTPGENRKAVPASLHMSLSLDTAKPLASVMQTRKSLIMEQMGDKDIVRRAFKTFQKPLNGITSSSYGMSVEQQQMSGKDAEQKVTRDLIPQKGNDGLRKSVEKTSQKGDLGNRSSHTTLVRHKDSGAGRKKPIADSPSARVRSDARFEKQREKSFTREAEKALPVAKTKGAKEAQMKKSKQGLNFKITVTPSYNRADMKPSRKEDNSKSHQ